MKDGNSNWRMEKEKLEKEIGSLGKIIINTITFTLAKCTKLLISLFSEPFLESLPQLHLLFLIVIAGPESLSPWKSSTRSEISWQILLTFSLSVFSACFGMSKFFNVGPSRLIPYDKMNLGFFVLMVNIASCFIAKGLLLGYSKGFLRFFIWSCLSLLPQMIFVSTYIHYVAYL